jgi:hypothetical protein
MEKTVKSGKETCFRRVARPISRLELVEIWRRDDQSLDTIEKEAFKNFRNIIEIRNRAVVCRKRLIKTWLFKEMSD